MCNARAQLDPRSNQLGAEEFEGLAELLGAWAAETRLGLNGKCFPLVRSERRVWQACWRVQGAGASLLSKSESMRCTATWRLASLLLCWGVARRGDSSTWAEGRWARASERAASVEAVGRARRWRWRVRDGTGDGSAKSRAACWVWDVESAVVQCEEQRGMQRRAQQAAAEAEHAGRGGGRGKCREARGREAKRARERVGHEERAAAAAAEESTSRRLSTKAIARTDPIQRTRSSPDGLRTRKHRAGKTTLACEDAVGSPEGDMCSG